jgi:hypothetical protein
MLTPETMEYLIEADRQRRADEQSQAKGDALPRTECGCCKVHALDKQQCEESGDSE